MDRQNHNKRLAQLESGMTEKSENWKLHEALFGEPLYSEPWSPTEADFDKLIEEQDCFEISLRKEKQKNEEWKKEIANLKKDVKTLKNANMKLEGDLRLAKNENKKIVEEKDEVITDLECRLKMIEKEMEILKLSQQYKPRERTKSSNENYQEVNNNDPSPEVKQRPKTTEIRPKRLSNVLQLIKGFESKQAEVSAPVRRTPVRRKTIHDVYREASHCLFDNRNKQNGL